MEKVATTNDDVVNVNVREERKKGNVAASWTGGKDGCFACYTALLDGFNVTHLLNFKDLKKHAPHNLNHDLLAAQSESMGIPMIYRDFVSYAEEFEMEDDALEQVGIRVIDPLRHGLPVIEPLKKLNRHEVLKVAQHLELPPELSLRKPFPAVLNVIRESLVGKVTRPYVSGCMIGSSLPFILR